MSLTDIAYGGAIVRTLGGGSRNLARDFARTPPSGSNAASRMDLLSFDAKRRGS
jgi:hypothetical protein